MPDNIPQQYKHVIELDRSLRKTITEYYFALNDLKDPAKPVEFLAGMLHYG
jgi:hypothetical protein